jgi:hypothetical protein
MSSPSTKSADCLGFLTVVENADGSLLGGYLLLNASGRPLEFHCTAPVKPNRTQEILYGPTLKPYLYGEQIGQTLLTKSKLTPVVVCTDSEAMLAVREFTHVPVVLVQADKRPAEPHSSARQDARPPGSSSFQLAKSQVVAAVHYADDVQVIRDAWPLQADHLNLLEPFTRIREALDEAQRSARQAA